MQVDCDILVYLGYGLRQCKEKRCATSYIPFYLIKLW